ncbi:MAG TPA: A24 family peptidase [Bryobacteraceae bacterium]|nr:A24 family peptidase [Bryobacteraceae bacterium]
MIQFTRPAVGIELILLLAVALAMVTDLRSRRIPNWLTVSTLLLGFALNALLAYPSPLEGVWLATKGFAFAFGLNLVMYMLHMTGAGDVKLLAAVGAMVGCSDFVGIFLLTALIGGVLAVVLMLVKGRVRQTLWNVGFMVGELMKWRAPHLTRETLDVGSAKALRLPGAVRIGLGVVAFLVMARVWGPA